MKRSVNPNAERITRIEYFDKLRCVACLAVILIHSSAGYVSEKIGSSDFWVGNCLDALARIGVPLFIMISGALMLDEKYNFNMKKLIRHIKRLVIFFAFWSVIYSLLYEILWRLLNKETIKISSIIYAMLEGHYHLWFVYMIVGLYLIVPLLRLWVKKDNKKYIEYFLLLSFGISVCIPQLFEIGSQYSSVFVHLNSMLEMINLKYVGGYTIYFILGWYLHNYEIKHRKLMYIWGVLGYVTTFCGMYVISKSTGQVFIQIYGDLTVNVFLQSVALFLVFKTTHCARDSNAFLQKSIKCISKNSLGIYAVHAAIVPVAHRVLSAIGMEAAIINIPITFVITFVFSLGVTIVCSKLPIFNKVI